MLGLTGKTVIARWVGMLNHLNHSEKSSSRLKVNLKRELTVKEAINSYLLAGSLWLPSLLSHHPEHYQSLMLAGSVLLMVYAFLLYTLHLGLLSVPWPTLTIQKVLAHSDILHHVSATHKVWLSTSWDQLLERKLRFNQWWYPSLMLDRRNKNSSAW